MTQDAPPVAPAHHDGAGVRTWSLTWQGVRTVVALELRQRVRSSRWKTALVVWVVVVGAITLLSSGALAWMLDSDPGDQSRGPMLFTVVTFLVLGLGLLVTPTLTSTAVNGDRAAGTLATLQVTLLSPAEIALGKLLAAWFSALAFLAASLPFLVLAIAMGDVAALALPRVVVLIALLLAAVCGIGLGWSTIAARPAGSTVLTFLTVAGLTIFTPVFFGITYPAVTETAEVTVYGIPQDFWQEWDGVEEPDYPACTYFEEVRDVAHTERTSWLLTVNPFVVVADGAGTGPAADPYGSDYRVDPLAEISRGVRDLAAPPVAIDECWAWDTSAPPTDQPETTLGGPVWPWGLAANLLLGAAGFVVAVRRLRIPQRTLARGTRVA